MRFWCTGHPTVRGADVDGSTVAVTCGPSTGGLLASGALAGDVLATAVLGAAVWLGWLRSE